MVQVRQSIGAQRADPVESADDFVRTVDGQRPKHPNFAARMSRRFAVVLRACPAGYITRPESCELAVGGRDDDRGRNAVGIAFVVPGPPCSNLIFAIAARVAGWKIAEASTL